MIYKEKKQLAYNKPTAAAAERARTPAVIGFTDEEPLLELELGAPVGALPDAV